MVRSCWGGDWWGALDQGNTAWWGAGGVPRLGGHSLMRVPGGLLCAWRVAGGERWLATVGCALSLDAAHTPLVIRLVRDGARRGAAPGSMARSNHVDRVLLR